MILPANTRQCHECQVIRFSRPPGQGPIRPCLSCSVSEDFEESDRKVPSLPWSETSSDVTNNGDMPKWLMRQKSLQKVIHQAEKCKKMMKRLVDKHGACNVTHNIPMSYIHNFITDLFTTLIDLRWRMMLLFFSLAYLSGWAGFSGLWYCLAWWHQDLGYLSRSDASFEPCVANVESFTGAFLFSLETQTTIGYGFRSVTEECWIGPSLVVIQSVFSALVDAILVGCVFVKIARPKKRAATIKFSHDAVIAKRDGKLCFMFRVGDIRKSHIFSAMIRAKLVRPRITQEEECIPLYSHPMDVGASTGEDSLLLVWPLIITHVIDEKSPLYKYSKADLMDNSFEIIVYLEGVVEQTGLITQARTSYIPSEIKWGHRFSSHIVSMADQDDKLNIDYSQFNVTYPATKTPRCSAYELDFFQKNRQLPKLTLANRSAKEKQKKKWDQSDDIGGYQSRGGYQARRHYNQLFNNKVGEKYAYDDPPDYNGVTTIDETISPPTTPTITGVEKSDNTTESE